MYFEPRHNILRYYIVVICCSSFICMLLLFVVICTLLLFVVICTLLLSVVICCYLLLCVCFVCLYVYRCSLFIMFTILDTTWHGLPYYLLYMILAVCCIQYTTNCRISTVGCNMCIYSLDIYICIYIYI